MVTFAVTNTYGVCLRSFWRQTTWPLCTSARFAVVVAFAGTNRYGSASAFLPLCPWFWHGLHPCTFGVSRSCQWCSLCSSGLHGLSALRLALLACSRNVAQCDQHVWRLSERFLETDYIASLHFGSLCCRGYLRSDQHVWRLLKVRPVPVPMLMPALAYFFLLVSVLMLMRVPVPCCHHVRGIGAAYTPALWSFKVLLGM